MQINSLVVQSIRGSIQQSRHNFFPRNDYQGDHLSTTTVISLRKIHITGKNNSVLSVAQKWSQRQSRRTCIRYKDAHRYSATRILSKTSMWVWHSFHIQVFFLLLLFSSVFFSGVLSLNNIWNLIWHKNLQRLCVWWFFFSFLLCVSLFKPDQTTNQMILHNMITV